MPTAAALDPARPPETTLVALLHDLDASTLREAVTICAERQYLEDRCEIDALRARYPGLRRYLPSFFTLPFQSEPGSEAIITGLDVVRQLDAGTLKTLPASAPTAFVPSKFRPALYHHPGTLERSTWELGLAVAIRDGCRSGDVYLPESRRHVSFPNLVYDPVRWQRERDDAYTELHLSQDPDDFCTRLQHEFDTVAQQAERGLARNGVATIRSGRLHLKKREALEVPPRIKHLRRTIEGALPHIRIEDLLAQVDTWCDFTRVFRQAGAGERTPRMANFFPTLLATLIAHGTNLGLAMMANSVDEGITPENLQEMSQWCLREDTPYASS